MRKTCVSVISVLLVIIYLVSGTGCAEALTGAGVSMDEFTYPIMKSMLKAAQESIQYAITVVYHKPDETTEQWQESVSAGSALSEIKLDIPVVAGYKPYYYENNDPTGEKVYASVVTIPAMEAVTADYTLDVYYENIPTYYITVNYHNPDGTTDEWQVSMPKGSSLAETVRNIPTVVGYKPFYYTENDNPSSEKVYKNTVTIPAMPNVEADYTRDVYYEPDEVSFTVIHYLQNVTGTGYTTYLTETKKGITGDTIKQTMEKNGVSTYAKDITGMKKNPLYDQSAVILPNGQTKVQIFYDRESYLVKLNLDGGFGVESFTARYGTSISVGTPVKEGKLFDYWWNEKDQTADTIPVTVPAEDSEFTARWTNKTSSNVFILLYTEKADSEEYEFATSWVVKGYKQTTMNLNSGDYTIYKGDGTDPQTTTPQKIAEAWLAAQDYGKNTGVTDYWKKVWKQNENKTPKSITVTHTNGNTLYNIYYDRKEFTITFKTLIFPLIGKTGGFKTLETITAKPESDIRESWNHDYVWVDTKDYDQRNSDTYVYQFMPWLDGDLVLYEASWLAQGLGLQKKNMRVYYETIESAKARVEDSQSLLEFMKSDIEFITRSNTNNSIRNEFIPLTGYTAYYDDPSSTSWNAIKDNIDGVPQYDLYYTRNSFKLKLRYGKGTSDFVTYTVPYGASLKDYTQLVDGMTLHPSDRSGEAYHLSTKWYMTEKDDYEDDANAAQETLITDKNTMPNSNLTIYTTWIPNTFSVVFKAKEDAGSIMATVDGLQYNEPVTSDRFSQYSAADATLAEAAGIDLEKFAFDGWYYRLNDVEYRYHINLPITRNLTVYAKWVGREGLPYTVYYYLGTGEKNSDGTYEIAKDSSGAKIEVSSPTNGHLLFNAMRNIEAKTASELYDAYKGGYRPQEGGTQVLVMDSETEKSIYFTYKKVERANYSVHYVSTDGTKLAETSWVTGAVASETVTASFYPISGYTPDAYSKTITLSADETKNVIEFVYTRDDQNKTAPYQVVHYKQKIDGDGYEVYQNSTTIVNVSDTTEYSETALSLTGFTYAKGEITKNGTTQSTNTTLSGKVDSANGLQLAFYYNRVLCDYSFYCVANDAEGVQHTINTISDSGRYEATIQKTAPEIKGYRLSPTQEKDVKIEGLDIDSSKNVCYIYYDEDNADIRYEVVPEDGGTLNRVVEEIKVDTGTPSGSTAAANSGYSFKGWYRDAACTDNVGENASYTPQKNSDDLYETATYYAKFAPITYNATATTDTEGISYVTGTGAYPYKTEVTFEAVMDGSKPYDFSGWFNGDTLVAETQIYKFAMPSEDITYTARTTPKVYDVTLNPMGGEIAEGKDVSSYTYTVGATLPTEADIVRVGYTFGGWYSDTGYEGEPITQIAPTETGAKNFYAKWTANAYQIVYRDQGNADFTGTFDTDYPQTHTYDTVTTLVQPTRTGYSFEGWHEDATCETEQVMTLAAQKYTADITIFAKWTADEYAITYLDQGGAPFTGTFDTDYPQTHTYDTVTPLVSPSKTGYTFDGWHTDEACEESALTSLAADGFTEDITLYAKWTAEAYEIVYLDQGGAPFTGTFDTDYPRTHTYDTETTLVPPTRTGYIFDGWHEDSTCETEQVTTLAAQKYTADITLYAGWTPEVYNIIYRDQGGEEFSGSHETNYPQTHTYGTETTLDVPTKEQYTFVNWYEDSSCETTAVTTLVPDGYTDDITLYAKWLLNKIDASIETMDIHTTVAGDPNTVSFNLKQLQVNGEPISEDQLMQFVDHPLYVIGITVSQTDGEDNVTLTDKETVLAQKTTWGYTDANKTYAITAKVGEGAETVLSNTTPIALTGGNVLSASDNVTFALYHANAITDTETERTVTLTLANTETFDAEATSTITLTLNIVRTAASINVTVPLCVLVQTNLDGGSVKVPDDQYAITNNSSMRLQLSKVEQAAAGADMSPLGEGENISKVYDKYNIVWQADWENHDIPAETENTYNPIDEIQISHLTFVTQPNAGDRGLKFSTITYTVQIPE